MKIIYCFIKTFKENLRDWKILILALVFAPFFVFMMYMYMGNPGSSEYNVIVINNDQGNFSSDLIREWEKTKTDQGNPILKIQIISDTIEAKKLIRNKDADLFITIPCDFSESFIKSLNDRNRTLSQIISYGDQANIKYMMTASYIDYITYGFISQKAGIENPLNIKYEFAGSRKSFSDFDLYIPAMLVLSIIMMLFTAGASIVREIEKDTVTRLTLSRLNSLEFMTAMSLNQIIIGLICLLLTLLAAFSVGYNTTGSVPLLILVGILTCFSVIGISIITACFINNMFGLLTLGCFPFFILMFFSDCFMPLPKINLFYLAGNQIYLNDILPTATATRAINKILNYNSGFSDVSFELIWILILSFIYFFLGVWLFRKKYKY